MLCKVELADAVSWFVKNRCTPDEQNAFYRRFHEVREKPLANSEPTFDPALNRYMLRHFRFGADGGDL